MSRRRDGRIFAACEGAHYEAARRSREKLVDRDLRGGRPELGWYRAWPAGQAGPDRSTGFRTPLPDSLWRRRRVLRLKPHDHDLEAT